MSIASTLSGKLSIKHPKLGVLCREDGAILARYLRTSKYCYTFGSRTSQDYRQIQIGGKHYFVHRLIAESFLPALTNKPLVDHINRIRSDNRVENLRWVTAKENIENSSIVINRDDRIPIRSCENKRAYKQAYLKLKSTLILNMAKPNGGRASTCILPQDIYDQLKPLSQRERFTAYHAWKQSLKV